MFIITGNKLELFVYSYTACKSNKVAKYVKYSFFISIRS